MCLKINCDRCDNAFVVIFFKTMYNKTIIRFGFCDIRNNQGRGKCYQPQPSASADNTYLSLRLRLITLTSTLIIPDITKTESNNCLFATRLHGFRGMKTPDTCISEDICGPSVISSY